MRSKLLLLALLCLTQYGLYAQVEDNVDAPLQQQNVDTEEKLKTKLGVKFTLGLHTLRGNAFDDEKPLFGFGGGMYQIINLNKNKRMKLHWEFNLNLKGSKFSKANDTSYSKISLAYVEVPVLLCYQLNKAKSPFYLEFGPQFGFMFKNSITQGYGKYAPVIANGLPFKKIDCSLAMALRKDLGPSVSIMFGVKYGLNNIYSDEFYNNPNYKGIYPQFKDGTHNARNLSFELSFMFGP